MSVVHNILRRSESARDKRKAVPAAKAGAKPKAPPLSMDPSPDIKLFLEQMRKKEQKLKAGIEGLRNQVRDLKDRLDGADSELAARDAEIGRLQAAIAAQEGNFSSRIQALNDRLADASADLAHERSHLHDARSPAPVPAGAPGGGSLLSRAKARG